MRISFDARRVAKVLSEINPLWLLAAGALLMVLVATHIARQHVRDSEWLQARLTGASLVDALHAYAEATPPGASPRPAALTDLIDDTRSGQHRNWLDAASAEALKDPANWKLLRDAKGGLLGAHLLNSPPGVVAAAADATSAGKVEAPSDGTAGASHDDLSTYVADADAVAVEPAAPTPQVALPQPVMPNTPAPTEESMAAAQIRTPQKNVPVAPAQAAVSAAPALRVTQAPVLGPPAATAARNPAALAETAPHLKPSRIIAALEARQVLRLSGGSDPDAPPSFPPRQPVVVTKDAKGRRADISIPDGAVAKNKSTLRAAPSAAPVGSITVSTATATAAAGKRIAATQVGAGRRDTRSAVSGLQPPQTTAAQNPIAQNPDSGSQKQSVASPAGVFSGIDPRATGGSPGNDGQQASLQSGYALPQPTMPTAGPNDYLPRPPRRMRHKIQPPADSSQTDPAAALMQTPTTGSGALLPASGQGANQLPSGSNGGVVGTANGGASANSLSAGATAGVRLDTVIYEDSQNTAASPPKNINACRALSGDSGECDALEDGDPDIYQRCYQSLSERINACIAGDPIPPLVTR